MDNQILLDGRPTVVLIATTLLLAGALVCLLVDAICSWNSRPERRKKAYIALMREHLRETSREEHRSSRR